jgi:hypothetical protein
VDNFVGLIVIGLICGTITAAIAQKRNLGDRGGWFLFGALLFIVALPMVIFSKPGLPQAPPGMRAVKCPRCNAVQNVGEAQTTYECWQCKTVNTAVLPRPAASALAPGAPVKVVAAGDAHEGQVGVIQELIDDDEDGRLDVCVKFDGDNEVYAFSRYELMVVPPPSY